MLPHPGQDCSGVRFLWGDTMELKDKKIEVLRQITTRDEQGFGTTALEPISAPIWAYSRQLSGKEVFAAATTNYKEKVLFTVNYNPK